MKDKKDKKLIQSLVRASDILNLFLDENKTMGIGEFAQALKLPKTTIQGLVNTLTALEYLERDPLTSRYRLGPMLFQLGSRYSMNMNLVATARVWMERLCFQFGIPINFGTMLSDRVVILFRIEPDNNFIAYPDAGLVIAAHTSCIGKIMLAFMEDKRRTSILKNYEFSKWTQNSISDVTRFETELVSVRENGIAFDNEENIRGLSGIGGPIRNHTGNVFAAFVVTGDTAKINEKRDEIIRAVRYTAEYVSAQLGYKSGK